MTNRPIKFRIWIKDTKKLVCWHENPQWITDSIPLDSGDEWTENCELMQFTGLLDKNGKEIYEGDILKAKSYEDWGDKDGFYYNHEVKFSTNKAGITNLAGFLYIPEDCEVIGNIFENRELL